MNVIRSTLPLLVYALTISGAAVAEQQDVQLQLISADLAGGKIRGQLTSDLSAEPRLALDFIARSIELGRLERFKDLLSGGHTDIDLKLSGPGTSIDDFLRSASGHLTVAINEGRVLNTGISLAEADMLLKAITVINPQASDESTTHLICGAVKGTITNGILTVDRGLAFETDRMTLVGSGVIRLHDQNVDISIRPRVREGLGLGAAGLAKMLRIQGTIKNPTFGVDAAGVATTGVQAGAAIATVGLSLLAEKLFKDLSDDPHPCFTLLGKPPPADDDTDGGVLDSVESATDTVTDTVKSATKSVGEGVKNLFDGLTD
jgi:uncharacterized protein involved in outer membrane biogenesis